MHQPTRSYAFLVMPCLAIGLLAQAPPPASEAPAAAAAQTVQIAPHESKWAYPKEVTLPPNTQLHLVSKGDTLWDLGAKYLGNPFAWPQIWELNKWVTDPHWIYPGDALIVDGGRTEVKQAQAQTQAAAPDEVAELQPDVKRAPKRSRDEFSYSIQDFLQVVFIAERGIGNYLKKEGAIKVVGAKDTGKDLQSDGDLVYLNGGTDQGFKTGDRLVSVSLQKQGFYHPDDVHHRKPLGDILQQSAILRITQTYPRESVALIEKSMDSVLVGHALVTFTEPVNLVANLRTDITDPVDVKPGAGKIIYIHDDKQMAGSGEMVLIDKGAAAGLRVGDDLIVTRRQKLDPTRKANAKDTQNIFVGQVIVVRTEEKSATCRILRNRTEIQVGDLITP